MRKLLLFFNFIFTVNLNAQILEFTYDNAGNQVQRELITITVNSVMNTNSVNNTEQEEDTLLPKSNALNNNSSTIEIFPNPVVDLVNVEWNHELNIRELMLYDNNGKLLQLKKVHQGTTKERFDLSSYSSGMYYIRIYDNSQQSKSFKIIKN